MKSGISGVLCQTLYFTLWMSVGVLRPMAAQATSQGLVSIVPAYFAATSGGRPICRTALSGSYSTLAAFRPDRVIAIMNPSNGPNLAAADVTLCWQKLSSTGVSQILGYVATGYGANNFTFNYPYGSTNRTLPVVLSYIDMYYSAYKCNNSMRVDGIFLDEAATWYYLGNGQTATPVQQLAYYTAVVARIREWDRKLSVRSTIVANPGGKVMPGLLSLDIDWVIGFESSTAVWTNPNYHGICPAPSFTKPVNPSNNNYCGGQAYKQYCPPGSAANCWCPGPIKFGAMVHSQPSSNFSNIITQARAAGYQAIYVTDKKLVPNPYSAISAYFSSMMVTLQEELKCAKVKFKVKEEFEC